MNYINVIENNLCVMLNAPLNNIGSQFYWWMKPEYW